MNIAYFIVALIFLIIGLIIGWLVAPTEPRHHGEEWPMPVPPPAKKISINVNCRTREFVGEEISYAQVLELAGVNVSGEKLPVRSVTYWVRKKPGNDSERSGIMHRGGKPVRVESDMVFNVADTSRA